MGSVADRYCASGEDCVHYKHLETPIKLSRYNPNDVCDACREVGRHSASVDVDSGRVRSNEDIVGAVGVRSDRDAE